jgi:drug/metabolite transporter (DMT)-like permease
VVEPIVPVSEQPRDRRPLLGVSLVLVATALFAVNGTVSKVILASGVSSLRLSQVRMTGALIGFVVVLLLTAPDRLRVRRRELPFLAVWGIGGLAFVQWFYFLAIHRLAIGIALLIEYIAPLFVALWAHYVFHERVRRRIWVALAFALAGLALIVNVRHGGTISTAGIVFALGSAAAYTFYILLAERGVGDRDAVSLLAWGFAFGALFWCFLAPWWSFPAARVGADVSLLGRLSNYHLPVWALMAFLILIGTIIPFFLLVSALRHLPATRVGIIAMLEPVVATIVAFAWLRESLGTIQVAGGAVMLAAIGLAQSAR